MTNLPQPIWLGAEPTTTAEMFAGIGGFRFAADQRNVRTVWANDHDPKACAVYRAQYGSEELVEADVRDVWRAIPRHDVLTAGFPCQPFSSAGKKEGTRDPRGTLFQVIVDALALHEPRYFVLENVKRLLSMENGGHFATVLGALMTLDYELEWRLVNVKNLGLPQNRQRVIIVGSKLGLTRDERVRIRLAPPADIVRVLSREFDAINQPVSWRTIESHARRFPTWGLARAGRFFAADPDRFSGATSTPKLRTVLESSVASSFDFTQETIKRLKESVVVNSFIEGVQVLSNQNGGARMGYTIYGVDGVAPTLTSTTSRHYERYKVGQTYRRLTNVEYARIQGFPDDHCRVIGTYDQYGLYGNAVPPILAGWALDQLPAPWAPLVRPEGSQMGMALEHA